MFWESQGSLLYYQWIIRAVIMFLFLMLMSKIMGQRQVGRLTLLDFIIGITIGSIAAGALNNSMVNLFSALISIATFILLYLIITYISLKNAKISRILQEEPIILIKNGKLCKKTMFKCKINLDDLLMELRIRKYPYLSDVEYAILEPNGKISVIPKSQARPVKTRDLNLDTAYEGYPVILIEDGNILEDNLRENNLDNKWLRNELLKQGIEDENNVAAAMLDTQGRLFVSKEECLNNND
ncbi:DUF421 domain-containing protein [Natronospora cellulosivora (SeqCode)]